MSSKIVDIQARGAEPFYKPGDYYTNSDNSKVFMLSMTDSKLRKCFVELTGDKKTCLLDTDRDVTLFIESENLTHFRGQFTVEAE